MKVVDIRCKRFFFFSSFFFFFFFNNWCSSLKGKIFTKCHIWSEHCFSWKKPESVTSVTKAMGQKSQLNLQLNLGVGTSVDERLWKWFLLFPDFTRFYLGKSAYLCSAPHIHRETKAPMESWQDKFWFLLWVSGCGRSSLWNNIIF